MFVRSTSETPNPDAMKFIIDGPIGDRFNITSAQTAAAIPLAAAIFRAPGVAAVFAVNDFITVTRVAGASWDPITEAVQEAVAAIDVPVSTDPPHDPVSTARQLLRDAMERVQAEDETTNVEIRRRPADPSRRSDQSAD